MSLYWPWLIEEDEVGGTSSSLPLLHGLGDNGGLTQVVTDHLWLDFHLAVGLASTGPPCCLPSLAGWSCLSGGFSPPQVPPWVAPPSGPFSGPWV